MQVKIKVIIRIIGIILVLTSIFIFIYLKYQNKKDVINQDKIINETFNENNNKKFVYNNDNFIDILGYIEIPKFNIKRIIKYGTNKEVLDNNYVGLHENSSNLDDRGNIILAGHNIDNVFKSLHKISIDDEIIINTSQNSYLYKVIEKKEISVFDTEYLKQQSEDILTLITCTNDKSKRLLVLAKKII